MVFSCVRCSFLDDKSMCDTIAQTLSFLTRMNTTSRICGGIGLKIIPKKLRINDCP